MYGVRLQLISAPRSRWFQIALPNLPPRPFLLKTPSRRRKQTALRSCFCSERRTREPVLRYNRAARLEHNGVTGAVTRWPDNRIGFSEQAAWRYDDCGNRVEQLEQSGQHQRLGYDGAHQLVEVISQGPTIGQQAAVGISTSRYVYDALGRRLKKRSASESDQASSY